MNEFESYILSNTDKLNIFNSILDKNSFDDFDFSLIKNLKVFNSRTQVDFVGKVIPIKTTPLSFNILFNKIIIETIIKQTKSYDYAKSVVLHELYHCKDMSIIANIFKSNEVFFLKIDTTKKYIFNLGLKQWSEYYAYYNSSQIYNSDILDVDKCIQTLFLDFKVIDDKIKKNKNFNMPELFLSDFETFIRKVIMLISCYNGTKNKKYIDIINKYDNNEYSLLHNYITNLFDYLDKLYINYPKWISEDNILEVGKKLLSFIKFFNIKYSTKDLSDNFIFTKK